MIKNFCLLNFFKTTFLFLGFSFLVACSSSRKLDKNYLYFQNSLDSVSTQFKELVIQPNDLLSIQVYSKSLNQDQATIFNIPNGVVNAGTAGVNSMQGYQVGLNGNIEMPIIGSVKASGLTKDQLQTVLVQKLSPYVKDPSVIVRYQQININVLGEVKAPGMHNFKTDKITVLDAISVSGDLTDYGKRENVLVIREESGIRKYYYLDLRSGTIFQSPGYQLQPNDIVYVSANKTKLKTLNIDPEAQRRTGLIFNSISLIVTVVTFIITLTK
jgi:polysaccharide biosynthesis/export protein